MNLDSFPTAEEAMHPNVLAALDTYVWDRDKEQAALMVAERRYRLPAIADEVGITLKTLKTWTLHPAFVRRVDEHRDAWRTTMLHNGITNKQERLAALSDRWRRLQTYMEDRGQMMADRTDIPGADQGIVLEIPPDPRAVLAAMAQNVAPPPATYKLDREMFAEFRELEKQAAMEEVNWVEQSANATELRIVVEYAKMPIPTSIYAEPTVIERREEHTP